MRAPAPAFAANLNGETIEAVRATLGAALIDAVDQVGEVALYVEREAIADALSVSTSMTFVDLSSNCLCGIDEDGDG